VRGELNGRNVEGCVRVAVLTRDGGDGGTVIEFVEGEAIAVLRTVSGGRQEEGRARGHVRVVRGRVGCGDGRKTGGDGGSTLLKGVVGRPQPRGAKARTPRGTGRAWGLAPTGRGPLGRRGNGRQRPSRGERGRRACPHNGGRRRVADERGPAGNRRARGRETQERMGRPGKKMEWAEPE
jgi:hypothetical protein